ncbi:acetate--CoA ligase family protein [uncultured Zhongshania sp.]|uniref:acetate--CoA ligase family protein n=1 Tax=uncultured Zhongshania sp. TaxID=1642288 RepID=UPI0030DB4ECF
MPTENTSDLNGLLQPRSIALVGAKDRSVWSVSAFENLKRGGFDGDIYLINPKGGIIHGMEAHTSCVAVGARIDVALLMVPESVLLDTFDDLHSAGVKAAVILSAGFAEAGEEGQKKQQAMAEKARAVGIRLLGPNCLGFANFLQKTAVWTTPLRRAQPSPAVALVSQSGALASQLEQFAYQQRVALTHMISTGNEADISVAEVIEYLSAQDEPKAIALFLESVRDPAAFIRAAEAAKAAGKTIVVLKVGSSEAAAKAAQAHTGSLVGDDAVFNALCKKLGIVRVHSLEQLIVTTDLIAQFGRIKPGAKGLALLAMSGGLCEIAVDQAEELGLCIPELSASTKQALADALPSFATPNNPLDLTGGAMVDPGLISTAIEIIATDPAVGAVGFVFDIPAKDDKRGFARSFIKEVSSGFQRISVPGLMLSHTFNAVSGEARSMADEYKLIYSGGGLNHVLTALHKILDDRETSAISNTITAAHHARPNSERAVLDFLAENGAKVIPAHIVNSADEAAAAATTLAAPVVLKILSEDIQHKTEVGGVLLNIAGAQAAADAYEQIIASVSAKAPNAKIEGVIVSPMRGKGLEIFVGTMKDPQWGQAITVGLGGIWVEALKDTSLRLLPVTEKDAKEMLSELRGGVLLDGFRGAPVVDRNELAKTIVAIGNAALALGPDLVSLEVNPILASEHGIEALDGLAIWE